MHPDWKWLIVGVLLALFVWPFVTSTISKKTVSSPANA
jgi:hypothetical protein